MFAEIYKLDKQRKVAQARLLWYKPHGEDIPNFEKNKID